jgi:hypothetical protein
MIGKARKRRNGSSGPSYNQLDSVRPESTFDSYEITDPSQERVKDVLQRLAASVIANSDRVASQEFPFPRTQLRFLTGPVGTGKTHLQEAFANAITTAKPELADHIFWSREIFTHKFMMESTLPPFEGNPIVLVDDAYQGFESADELHPLTDLAAFSNFLRSIYPTRSLVIASSNIPIEDLLRRIDDEGLDSMHKSRSRLREMLGQNGEFKLEGPDFRSVKAARAAENPDGDIDLFS